MARKLTFPGKVLILKLRWSLLPGAAGTVWRNAETNWPWWLLGHPAAGAVLIATDSSATGQVTVSQLPLLLPTSPYSDILQSLVAREREEGQAEPPLEELRKGRTLFRWVTAPGQSWACPQRGKLSS